MNPGQISQLLLGQASSGALCSQALRQANPSGLMRLSPSLHGQGGWIRCLL